MKPQRTTLLVDLQLQPGQCRSVSGGFCEHFLDQRRELPGLEWLLEQPPAAGVRNVVVRVVKAPPGMKITRAACWS